MPLLDTLKLISEAEDPFPLRDSVYLDDIHPLVQQAVHEANDELITIKGTCNWRAIQRVKKEGYKFYPGGRIRTPKGVLVYG